MRKILPTLLIIFTLPTISKAQKSIETEYQICIKALDFIKAKNIEGLKGLTHKGSFKNMTDEKFAKAIDELYDLVVGVENPTIDRVLIMTSISQNDGQKANIYSLGFPFLPISRRDDERGVQLVFMFSKEIKKNKIIGWKVRDFGVSQEDKKFIPSFDKFDFQTRNIKSFRIVYKPTTSIENHPSISGDSIELSKINIKAKLDEIFSLINNSKIEKKDSKSGSLSTHPNLELDGLQFIFSNYDNKLLPITFDIAVIRSDDPEIDEEYGDYLVVRVSGTFRYFINTNDNPAIVTKIRELRETVFKPK